MCRQIGMDDMHKPPDPDPSRAELPSKIQETACIVYIEELKREVEQRRRLWTLSSFVYWAFMQYW